MANIVCRDYGDVTITQDILSGFEELVTSPYDIEIIWIDDWFPYESEEEKSAEEMRTQMGE